MRTSNAAVGVWVHWRGGVKRFRPRPICVDTYVEPPPREPVEYDVSSLRACASCPATIAQPCMLPDGTPTSTAHRRRLISRRCACGALVVHSARQCVHCAFETWAAA